MPSCLILDEKKHHSAENAFLSPNKVLLLEEPPLKRVSIPLLEHFGLLVLMPG